MVRTKSRATSPGHQESRDASSNPHQDHQSALVMQQFSIQHIQSMATAMAVLTHQNQELTSEINLRRKRHEGYVKGQAQSQEDEEEMLSPRASQRVPFHEGCHTWRRRWIR